MSWMGLPLPRAAHGKSEVSWMGLPFPRAAQGKSEVIWMGLVLPRSSGHLGTKLLRGLYKKCRAHRSKSIFTPADITQ